MYCYAVQSESTVGLQKRGQAAPCGGVPGCYGGGGGVKLANVTEEVVVMYARRQHGEECR